MIYYFSLYAKTLACELNPDLKANLNERTIVNTTYNNQPNITKQIFLNIYHFPSTEVLGQAKLIFCLA